MKKLLSFVLVLALVLSFAPVSKAKALNVRDEDEVQALIKTPATLVSDTNPVSVTGEVSDGLVAGRTVKWDHQLYTLEGKITNVTSTTVSLEYNFNVKVDAAKALGFEDAFYYGRGQWINYNGGDKFIDANEEVADGYYGVKTTGTIKKSDLTVGVNGFIFAPELNLKFWGGGGYTTIDKAVMNIVVAPKATTHKESDSDFSIYKNSLSIGKACTTTNESVEVGTVVAYRVAGSSDWKEATFTSGKSLNVTGLSPNTKYEYKTKNYVKGTYNSEEYTLASDYSTVNKVNTAGVAPKVKSIKKTKVKQYQVNVPGQWKNHKYYPAHKEWRTSYTLKVTLSSVPKNIYKIGVDTYSDNSAPVYVKPAKSFKVTFVENGKTKGKKSKIYVYTLASSERFVGSSDNKGKSAVTTKTVKH